MAEGDDDNTNRLEMMRSEYAKAHKILNKFGNANMGRIEVMRLLLDNGISQKTANIFASKRSIKEQGVAEAGPNAPYTPSPAKPFRNPKGFNKQGTGVGNKLAGGFENWFWFLPFATDEQGVAEVKQRLDAKCWAGKHKEGTKIKGGVRVNNCVPNEGVAESYWTKLQNERNTRLNSLVNELSESVKKIK